jgi:hypothetical protein
MSKHIITRGGTEIKEYTSSDECSKILEFLHNKVKEYHVVKLIMEYIESCKNLSDIKYYSLYTCSTTITCNCQHLLDSYDVLCEIYEKYKYISKRITENYIRCYVHLQTHTADNLEILYHNEKVEKQNILDCKVCLNEIEKEVVDKYSIEVVTSKGWFAEIFTNQIVYEFLIQSLKPTSKRLPQDNIKMLTIIGDNCKIEGTKSLLKGKSKLIDSILEDEDVKVLQLPLLTQYGVNLLDIVVSKTKINVTTITVQEIIEYAKMINYLMMNEHILCYFVNSKAIKTLMDYKIMIENRQFLETYTKQFLSDAWELIKRSVDEIGIERTAEFINETDLLKYLSFQSNILIRICLNLDIENFEVLCTPRELCAGYLNYMKNKSYVIQFEKFNNQIGGNVETLEEYRILDYRYGGKDYYLYKIVELPEDRDPKDLFIPGHHSRVNDNIRDKFGLTINYYKCGDYTIFKEDKYYTLETVGQPIYITDSEYLDKIINY